jgi:hypothetical protein
MDWKTLNSLVDRWRTEGVGNDEKRLKRTPAVEDSYKKRKQELEDSNQTLEHEIRRKYFSGPDAGRSIVITENEFPYDLEDGIEHLVVWGNPDLLDEDDFRRFGPASLYHEYLDHDITWFINPTGWRSIEGVPHAHAFIRQHPDHPWCTCNVYYYSFALYPEGCQPVQTHCLGCGKIYERFYK